MRCHASDLDGGAQRGFALDGQNESIHRPSSICPWLFELVAGVKEGLRLLLISCGVRVPLW
jgi:hypothetical protein